LVVQLDVHSDKPNAAHFRKKCSGLLNIDAQPVGTQTINPHYIGSQ